MKRILVLSLFAVTYQTFGLSESLPEPRIFFPKGYDTNRAAQITGVLRSDKLKYLDGMTSYWGPEFSTTLVYGGNSAGLHAFIAALNQLDGVKVRLTFSPDLSKETGSALSAGSWWVKYSHTAPDTITVRINLAAESLGGEKFELSLPKSERTSPKQNRATYQWENKLQLSSEQQKLLHLHVKLEGATDALRRKQLEEQIGALKSQLGDDAVRPSRPSELVLTKESSEAVSRIYNPSDENVAFTASVKDDEEWLGSRKGSIGRLTYLPPQGSLIVHDLYWTTPSMNRAE